MAGGACGVCDVLSIYAPIQWNATTDASTGNAKSVVVAIARPMTSGGTMMETPMSPRWPEIENPHQTTKAAANVQSKQPENVGGHIEAMNGEISLLLGSVERLRGIASTLTGTNVVSPSSPVAPDSPSGGLIDRLGAQRAAVINFAKEIHVLIDMIERAL